MTDDTPSPDPATAPAPDDHGALLRSWTDALLAELDLAGTEVDIDAVLGLAGVVARGVVRPAAPLTAFLVGLAVGRAGADAPEAFERAAHRARALAATGDFAA